MIKTFILDFYLKNKKDHGYSRLPINSNLWIRMLKMMYNQIESFYPNSEIHIITNIKNLPKTKKTYFHFKEIENQHTSKFYIYGLLDKPAMYLDIDIAIIKNFEEKHLNCSGDFNLYRSYSKPSAITKIKEFKSIIAYNAAVIWVKQPNKNITKRLFEINQKWFQDKISLGISRHHDENALAVYINENKIKMNIFSEVNKERLSIKKTEIKNNQTIHYSGSSKLLYLKEFIKI